MKAYVLHGRGDLRLEDTERPKLKEREVLVEVKAAGICGSDIGRIYGTAAYSYPLIPGHEFSGVVVRTGKAVDRKWIGQRVGVFPLIPCTECAPCRKGVYELCRNYGYLGSRTDGGFAEYVAAPEWNLIKLPGHVSFESAAMLEPMAVAVHAMRLNGPRKDESVGVYGLGTIGLLLLMFLKEAGIPNVFAVGNKDSQRELAVKTGIPKEKCFDSRNARLKELIREQTEGMGADVIFECVGKQETISSAVDCVAPGGRVQLVGNPASDIRLNQHVYWKILRNQLNIKGSWNSSFTRGPEDDWHYVLERLAGGRVAPEQFITRRLAFDELRKGLHIMRDKTEEYGKIMVHR